MTLFAGTYLMSLAIIGVAPATSQAGCGHYALSKAERASLESLSGLPTLDLAIGDGSGSEPTEPRPRPCSGPSCSEGPGVPLTPPPHTSVRAKQWCCTTALPPHFELERASDLAEPAPLSSLNCWLAIERPPRMSATSNI
jgi:hypothetical protein